MHDFDLFVVGGGSGGVRAARVAASHGARVAIAEEHRMGGTCVIRGCVPKKLMVYASRFRDTFDSASSFGWNVVATRFDWVRFSSAMHREVDRLEAAYRTNLQRAGVHIHDERAVIEDACTVRLTGSGQRLSARNILVATGARPAQLHGVPGGRLAITSNEIFGLAELPRRVLVVGGGYIAVEFAAVLAGLGCRVVLAYRADRLLRGFDDDIRAALEADYARRGIVLARACVVASIQQARDGLLVTLSDGNTLEVDQVLVATGRRPNTDGLGLDAAGVVLSEDGAIAVDAESRTVIDSIFAVGDVTNRICLTPVAIREAQAFADTQYGGQPTRFEHGQVATAVFSSPEIGVIGMTEQQARGRAWMWMSTGRSSGRCTPRLGPPRRGF